MNRKKIIALAASILAIVAIAVGGTIAYFTDTAAKTNTFTVGNVEIDLTEPKWDEEGGGKDQAEEAYPGEALAKDPTVENTGANPAFVRISVTGLNQFDEKGAIIYRTDYVDNTLGTDWVLHTDGYFYYSKVLMVGDVTDALFDQIVIPTGLTNEDRFDDDEAIINYDVVVTAQAVQAQGARPSFTAVQAMTVAEIAAWFTTAGL